MSFARFFFARQVAGRLYAMGWRRKDMPTKTMFKDLCGALRDSGYDAGRAASLWNGCLQYDRDAIEQLKRDTGFYGILHLSQFFEPVDESREAANEPSGKRRTATRPRKSSK
jgi:hypothetical protein